MCWIWISREAAMNLYVSTFPMWFWFSAKFETWSKTLSRYLEAPWVLAFGHLLPLRICCLLARRFWKERQCLFAICPWWLLTAWQRALCSFSVHSYSLGLFLWLIYFFKLPSTGPGEKDKLWSWETQHGLSAQPSLWVLFASSIKQR